MDSIAACAECGAKNRVRRPPENQLPACGRCGGTLPWISKGTDGNFGDEISAPVPVLVDFWAPWCAPCRFVAPVLEELAREQRGKLKVVKLNIDENPASAARFKVMSIPTLILFRDGEALDTVIGAIPKQALLQRLSPHLVSEG